MRCCGPASTVMALILTGAFACAVYGFHTAGGTLDPFEIACLTATILGLMALRAGEREGPRMFAVTDGAPAGLEVARAVARDARAGAALLAVAGAITGTALIAIGITPWALGLPVVALAHAAAVGLRAQRILGAKDFASLTATTDRRRIFVARGDRLASWLHTTPAQLARVRDRTLPAAVARLHTR